MYRTLLAWHHAWCRPDGETRVGSEEDAPVSPEEERNMALVRASGRRMPKETWTH
jgi:hypothetical protein